MIGRWVLFQTDYGALTEGEVIDYEPHSGVVTVRNLDEDVWTGPKESVFPVADDGAQ